MSAPWLLVAVLVGAQAQTRPDEASLFDDAPTVLDAGVLDLGASPLEGRDSAQLGGPAIQNKFDTDEVKSDALKLGGTLSLNGQGTFSEGKAFEQGTFSAPMILDAYLDGRPNDRIRAFALGRLQYDPTRPAGDPTPPAGAPDSSKAPATSSAPGLTTSSGSNPSVALDQLWLRFDIARAVYLTVGRQKVRWGVSRIWYPTDFLNSQPRDALNPFDARLGVNLVKVHVPVESLGWNFYAYGLLDGVKLGASGASLDQVGGALRAEFVVGKAEVGLGGVWQKGRRPRYGVDVSTALGPFDFYAEAAFRDGRDFTLFRGYSNTLATADFSNEGKDHKYPLLSTIEPYHPEGLVVQVSGGLSWQFNYTDKNTAILGLEYFYNPAGYDDPIAYQVKTLVPKLAAVPDVAAGTKLAGTRLDPIQNAPLYGGRHNLALTLSSPGIPGYDWITVSLSDIVVLNDPSALTRLDVIFRVLTYLNVQAFAAVIYGQPGGQLRFVLTDQEIAGLSTVGVTGDFSSLRYAPLVQAGVVLRVSI